MENKSNRHYFPSELNNLTGIAAILRFPLPEDSFDSDEESERNDDGESSDTTNN